MVHKRSSRKKKSSASKKKSKNSGRRLIRLGVGIIVAGAVLRALQKAQKK